MLMKPDKKMAVGVYLTTIVEFMNLGYKDVNEYIDALKQHVDKLTNAKDYLMKEIETENAKLKELDDLLNNKNQTIKELETRLKEKERAKEKEQR